MNPEKYMERARALVNAWLPQPVTARAATILADAIAALCAEIEQETRQSTADEIDRLRKEVERLRADLACADENSAKAEALAWANRIEAREDRASLAKEPQA